MNQETLGLAQACFRAALEPGASVPPAVLREQLAQLDQEVQPASLDVEFIGHGITEEFPFLDSMIGANVSPDAKDYAVWEAAVRWVLNELRTWGYSEVYSLKKLCILLRAIMALDAKLAGLSCVASRVVSDQLLAALKQLIESASAENGFNDREEVEARKQYQFLADSGDLAGLWHRLPHLMIFPVPDFWAAVTLVYNAAPSVLSDIVERRDDVLFSFTICAVLGSQVLELSVRVDNINFKFVSVVSFCSSCGSKSESSSQNQLQDLLLQVAEEYPDDWASWMRALFRSPGKNVALNSALAGVLDQLSLSCWRSFFEALSLDYSYRAAGPVANIIIPFANSGNAERKVQVWGAAYQVWSDWGYGKQTSGGAMFAPAACALDFPVAMYYASLESNDRLAEESRLLEAIDTLEQQWFSSLTELITERNRLRSRLRLVFHGAELAKGSNQALPPPVDPPDLYDQVRYHYHDVSSV